jgi:chromosome segregation ATPase
MNKMSIDELKEEIMYVEQTINQMSSYKTALRKKLKEKINRKNRYWRDKEKENLRSKIWRLQKKLEKMEANNE